MVRDLSYRDLGNPFHRRPWMTETGAGSGHGQSKGLRGIVAGGMTGAMEACISYPTEYVKTQLQLDSKGGQKQYTGIIDCVQKTIKKHGFFGLYRGLSVLVYGSIPKVSTRFGTFEVLKSLTEDESGHVTRLATFFNGMGAGCVESILAVTPMETIKVRMVNDRRLPNPRYKGLFHAISTIIKDEGIKGVYKGVVPTTLKQGSSQAIRFFVVDSLKMWYKEKYNAETPVYLIAVFGVTAGVTSALANTPIDVVKTKMQGLEADKYNGTIDCIKKIYQHDGLAGFYKGLIPRLIRVSLDVGVTFTLYDTIMKIFNIVWPENK